MIGNLLYLDEWNVKKVNDVIKNKEVDYDVGEFLWSNILNKPLIEFNDYLYASNYELDLVRDNSKINGEAFNDSSPDNIYDYADVRTLTKVESNGRKLSYNEALYTWLSLIIPAHPILADSEFLYYYVDRKVIKDIINRDIVIFRNRMRNLRDQYNSCPIRIQSLYVLDTYHDDYTKESEMGIDFDRYDDLNKIEEIYPDGIEKVEFRDEEYIDAKMRYINNIINKIIIENVQSFKNI